MAYHYTVHPDANLVLVTASGFVLGEEILASADQMANDARWARGMHQLCNYLDVQAVAVTLEQMKYLASLECRGIGRLRGSKLAFVADTFDVILLCELFMGLTRNQSREMRLFHSLDAARAWLDAPRAANRVTRAARPSLAIMA